MTDTVSRWEVLSPASCAVETGRGGSGKGGWGERPVLGPAWQNWGGGCSHTPSPVEELRGTQNVENNRGVGQMGPAMGGYLRAGFPGSRGWVSLGWGDGGNPGQLEKLIQRE